MNCEFWLRLALAAGVILAIWNMLAPGELLAWFYEKLKDHWWGKPLGLCPPCAASVWGTAVWFYTGGGVWEWPLFVLVLSGVMVIITRNAL